MLNKNEILSKLNQVPYWFQHFEVAPGIFTPGLNPVLEFCDRLQLPKDLTGMTVLDVGAYDGGFSFECERRGASQVVAYDLLKPTETGFSIAKEILGSSVEYVQGSVYKLDPDIIGTFDIVLFAGVLYHLRHPLLAIDLLRTVTRKFCLVETQVIDHCFVTSEGMKPLSQVAPYLQGNPSPICQFYEHAELNGDPSNWFSPNIVAVMAWFRSAGFNTKHLDTWGSRAAFRADVVPGTPPFLEKANSYEGRVSDDPNLSIEVVGKV
ncbi:DUF1698 domain-containing protein [Phormidesmis priestleyi]